MAFTDRASEHFSREPLSQGGGKCCGGGHWSVANIVAMVLGFLVFAPLGFAVLVWTLLGHPVQELPAWVRQQWNRYVRGNGVKAVNDGDNVVFNEYQQTQHDRIREIKEEIRNRAEAFRAYRADSKRRQDRKEFDDFMSSNPDSGGKDA